MYGGAEPSATDAAGKTKAEKLAKTAWDMAEATCLTPVRDFAQSLLVARF